MLEGKAIELYPEFPCSSCGACCRRAHLIPNFPEPLKKDGSCSHLMANNQCAIYDTRPDICSVHKVYDEHFNNKMTIEEYHEMTIKSCNEWIQDDYGENSLYLIPTKPQNP